MEKRTLTFDEKVKGWTSFHSFNPDFMQGMNNSLYSFRDGDLYVHNSENVPRNTYYGVQYPSKVSLMVNDSPSDIKELLAVSLEGNNSWETLITAYISGVEDNMKSTIKSVEFIKKEGIWYAYARRNESSSSFDSKSTYGIGVITQILGGVVKVRGGNATLTSGDLIIRGSDLAPIGNIISSQAASGVTTMTLSSVVGLAVGDFLVGQKDSRVEGGNLRGYTMRMDLEITKGTKVELFSVNSEVIKSFS
jgi:hypothetical protein